MVSPSSSNLYNSGWILMSILLSKPLLMICQIRPKIKCSLPSIRSWGPMLTTEHPIPLAEVITMLLFSVIWKALRGRVLPALTEGLLRTRSSIVSGTASLMSLQRIRPSKHVLVRPCKDVPLCLPRHSSNNCIVSVGMGRR